MVDWTWGIIIHFCRVMENGFGDGQSDFTSKLLTISAHFTFQTEVDDIPGALAPFQVGK